MTATNFDELVVPMAWEAPHAVLLDWYRRLELSMHAYLASRGRKFRNGPKTEAVIAADPLLGAEVADRCRALRELRNEHAHEWHTLQPGDAVVAARECLWIIGCLMQREDVPCT